MLPDINLDNESFDEIFENARNLIASTYPEWTDFNYHDPGTTMLEMFAWLKESQQYYINKIGPENINKYLKLLGLYRRPKRPSSTDVAIYYENDFTVARGAKLYAGDICFEADRRTYISSASVEFCISDCGEKQNVVAREQFDFGGSLHLLPFSKKDSGVFYIGFDKPLAKNELHNVWFDVTSDDGVARNPIVDAESFIPLVDIEMEFFDGADWQRVDYTDETFAFLFSGRISFSLPAAHCACEIAGHSAYYVRFSVIGGEYDALPVINNLYFHILPVTQRDTKAEYVDLPPSDRVRLSSELAGTGSTKIFLRDSEGLFTPVKSYERQIDGAAGEVIYDIPGGAGSQGVRIINTSTDFGLQGAAAYGTGLPFQQYELHTAALEYDTFAIMTELPDSGGRYVEWKKVRDFSAAGNYDFVYRLDTENGVFSFGDCINGMAPEGEIHVIGYSLTRGADGCVTKNKIKELRGFDGDKIRVENPRPATGGKNEESLEACFMKAQRLLQSTETIITDEDCERCVARTQGLRIEKSKVIKNGSDEGIRTTVVVKPYSRDGMGVPSARYIKNILAALEPRRMLGTQFIIVKPHYAMVSVFADVTVSKEYAAPKDAVCNAVTRFFDAIRDDFGAQIIYSRLYEAIDSLDCVTAIHTLSMQAEGSNVIRTREGDLRLERNVAAYLDDLEIMINL